MTIAAGAEVYNVDASAIVARGRSVTADERDSALNDPVRELVEDAAGKQKLKDAVATIELTGFQKDSFEAILEEDTDVEDWRVGEAYSESYLTVHRECLFPWPDKWDERKSGSSLPGADLAGLQKTDDAANPYRFAYGEVKTSCEARYPPSAVYGRTGLKQQMEDLRDSQRLRNDLFRYLGMRANGSDWHDKWKSAASRYLGDSTDVSIFGVMIRDVPPDEADLRARSVSLARGCPANMVIELLAIYFPAGSISGFAEFYKEGTADAGN